MDYLDVYGNKRKSHKPLIRFWVMWSIATFSIVSDSLFISTLLKKPCDDYNGTIDTCDPDAGGNKVKGAYTRAHFARCVQDHCLLMSRECNDVAHCYGENAYGCITAGLGVDVRLNDVQCIKMPLTSTCLSPPLCKAHKRCDVTTKLRLAAEDTEFECSAVGMDYKGAGVTMLVCLLLKELFKAFAVVVLFSVTVYHKIGQKLGWHIHNSDTDLSEVASLSFNSPLAVLLVIDKPTFYKFIKEASRDSVEMILADLLLEDIPACVISAVFMFRVGVQAYPLLSLLSSMCSVGWIIYRTVLRRRYVTERKTQRQRAEERAKQGNTVIDEEERVPLRGMNRPGV